jgi:hypothetical protein
MVHIKRFKNGKLSWELKIGAAALGVLALVAIALAMGVDTSPLIASLWRK